MIITNKFNLPQTFVNVMKRPTYSKGKAALSATELINSPRIVQLRKAHEAELEYDVSEMVWSIFGTAVHGVLEHGKDENHIVEERLHAEVDGWSISGAIDLQLINEDGTYTINDYKTTGAWAVMNEKADWEHQLNIYAWLVEKVKGVKVSKLEIVAIIRDWSRRDAAMKVNYPDAPIKVIPIQLWTQEFREQFIRDRVTQHSNAMLTAELGETLPYCTPEQMWEKPPVFAIMKEGNVRAKSVHALESEATVSLEDLKKAAKKGENFYLEVRKGDRTRCENFCQVSKYCDQHQAYLASKEGTQQ
jgi:hypothetical protein